MERKARGRVGFSLRIEIITYRSWGQGDRLQNKSLRGNQPRGFLAATKFVGWAVISPLTHDPKLLLLPQVVRAHRT
jgi:hypothetical protein